MRLLADEFGAVCRRFGERVAVVDDGLSLPYNRLLRWSETISRELGRGRLAAGGRVALVLPSSAAFAASFIGAARAGAVAAPLNPGYRPHELEPYLADMQPAAVIVDHTMAGGVHAALGRLAARPALLMVGGPGECEALTPGDTTHHTQLVGDEPPALLLYTSGTTGPPKRAIRSHARLLAELDALRRLFGVTPDDRFLGAAPFFHVNGLVRSMLTALLAGTTLYPLRPFSPGAAQRLISRERLTFFGGVPQMFVLLTSAARREAADLSSLRTVFSASAPLLPQDNHAFQRVHGLFVRQLYGSTETGTIAYNNGPDLEARLGSVGRAIPGVAIAVLGEDGAELGPGLEGEIAVSSRFAIPGYDGDPAATRDSFGDDRYLTGDLGYLYSDGYLTLTGRKSLVINRGGYKVNPFEVEEAIRQHPKVADVVVLGAPAPHGDQLVRCLVVARESCSAPEIVEYCRARIADYKIPSRIEFRDSLPRTQTGKLRRAEL